MTGELSLVITISTIIVVIILSAALLSVLYKQATKDRAYVRTGYGGEIIALNSGIFILPILHHAIPVNLKAMGLVIELGDDSAVLTQDYMKANLTLVFYLRVTAEKESISQIARTLGDLTIYPEKLNDFLSGQLIHAIRKASAEMNMIDIHQQPTVFVEKIRQAVSDDLKTNSLQVDRVSLKHFNQSAKEFYSENNAFEAKGLSGLTKIIQSENQVRHELEQQTILQTKQKDLEMEKLIIEMDNKKIRLRLDQEREVKIFEAANELKISQDAINKNAEKTQAKILADQELQIAKHQSEIILAEKLREKLKQQIATDLIRAEAVKAEVHIKLTRKFEKADNQVKIELLNEKRKDEYETAKIVEQATARKFAAVEDADALRITAEGEIDKLKIIENHKLEAEKSIEDSLKNRYQNEAEGLKVLIAAFNLLPKSELPKDLYPELIELFSELCLGNNELMRQCGYIERHIDSTHNTTQVLSKHKQNGSITNKSKTKLQAILEDARTSLTEEAINAINDSSLKKTDDLFSVNTTESQSS